MDNFDVSYRILLETHPYYSIGLCNSNNEYRSICNDKLFIARLANKWCWPGKSVEEIMNDLPKLTYNQVVETSLFYSPLGGKYNEDGILVNAGSIGRYNPVSLYYQACIQGYEEEKCMLFINDILNHPMDIDLEYTIARIVPIHMIAVKYGHLDILNKLRDSLLLRSREIYGNVSTNIGSQLYDAYQCSQLTSFTLCSLTEHWLGVDEENQSSYEYIENIQLGNQDSYEISRDIQLVYMKYMIHVGIGLDLETIFKFILRSSIGREEFSTAVRERNIEYEEENPYIIMGYTLSNLLADEEIEEEMGEVTFTRDKVTIEDEKLSFFLSNGIFSHLWDNDMDISEPMKLVYRPDLLSDYSPSLYTKESLIKSDNYYELLKGIYGEELIQFNRLGLVGYNSQTLKNDTLKDYHPDH